MTASALIPLLTFALFSRCTVKLSDSSDPPGSSTATPSETTEQTDLKLLYLSVKTSGSMAWFLSALWVVRRRKMKCVAIWKPANEQKSMLFSVMLSLGMQAARN